MRLIAEKLGGDRGGEPVFRSVDFALDRGQALVVTGPNGSGKSTLLRVLAALLPAVEGRVLLEGGGEPFPTVASASHYLGHQNGMKAALTVVENLAFWRGFMGAADSEGEDEAMTVGQALTAVGLGGIGHLPFGYLSTGQRRRAAIARLAIISRPLWLLDEPTAGLDKASEARFSEMMTAHCKAGGIIVAATHLPLGIAARELRMGSADA